MNSIQPRREKEGRAILGRNAPLHAKSCALQKSSGGGRLSRWRTFFEYHTKGGNPLVVNPQALKRRGTVVEPMELCGLTPPHEARPGVGCSPAGRGWVTE